MKKFKADAKLKARERALDEERIVQQANPAPIMKKDRKAEEKDKRQRKG